MATVASFVQSRGNDADLRAHLTKVLESPPFAHAHQLQSLLRYLMEAVLEGREDELKEYTLGREVFRRGVSYDPRTDAIVRVQVSILRKKLAAYYEQCEPQAPLRIVIPRGSYVPTICEAEMSAVPPVPEPQELPLPGPNVPKPVAAGDQLWRPRVHLAVLFLAGILCGVVLYAAWQRSQQQSYAAGIPADVPRFDARRVNPHLWGELLQQDSAVHLAFGCPQFFNGNGLYVRDVHLNQPGPEGERAGVLRELNRTLKTYLAPAPNTYTGVGEIVGIHAMTQFLSIHNVWAGLDNAQLLTPEQVRNKNLIVVSSYRFRTVLDLLDLPQAFGRELSGDGGITVPDPRGEERPMYQTRGAGGVGISYGIASYWKSPKTGGRILLLTGIDSWSTEGMVRYITDEQKLRELERHIPAEAWQSSKGVQVLVEIESQENRPTSTRYVTHRLL